MFGIGIVGNMRSCLLSSAIKLGAVFLLLVVFNYNLEVVHGFHNSLPVVVQVQVRVLTTVPSKQLIPSTGFALCGTQQDDDKNENSKPSSFWEDLKGMFQNFDDVVDDFVYKRMGAGEQWYGKRKYNPSGRVEGDYNGMGRSDYFRIEIARVQREEMERRKQQRLEEEATTKKGSSKSTDP